jgi:cupredoxin-like protein
LAIYVRTPAPNAYGRLSVIRTTHGFCGTSQITIAIKVAGDLVFVKEGRSCAILLPWLTWAYSPDPTMKPLEATLLAALVTVFASVAGGCKAKSSAGASTSSGPVPRSMSVNVEANEKGFTPSSFELQKGAPATLIFRRTTDKTCATEVVFPELKITKELPLMVPVPIEVPTGDARTLVFQCGMGMFKGKALIH